MGFLFCGMPDWSQQLKIICLVPNRIGPAFFSCFLYFVCVCVCVCMCVCMCACMSVLPVISSISQSVKQKAPSCCQIARVASLFNYGHLGQGFGLPSCRAWRVFISHQSTSRPGEEDRLTAVPLLVALLLLLSAGAVVQLSVDVPTCL